MGQSKKLAVMRVRSESFRWALISIVLFSLVATLATRTFHTSIQPNPTVQCHAAQAMRQHLARDAAEWTPAVPYGAVGVNVQVPVFNGFLYSAKSREADLRAQAERQRLADLRNRIARDVRTN